MSLLSVGSVSQSQPAISPGTCPVKASHDCFLAECTRMICEHAAPVLVLVGFGIGLAHCFKNFKDAPLPATAKTSETKTAKASN